MKSIKKTIPFNASFKTGDEINYIDELIKNQSLAGNHKYTKLCHEFFEEKFHLKNTYLTSSCSKALEIAAQLCNLLPEDEVIIPSFSYITDASSFFKTGAKIVFADSEKQRPHIDAASVLQKITAKTKALLIIHYAGIPCNMDEILTIVKKHNLILIEDCAQAIGVKYKNEFVGGFGDFATFSFHETKNIHCGEGGLLVVKDEKNNIEARRIWQEGTDKFDFENGLKKSYEWVTLGSSYQPSELSAAFLYAQLQGYESVNNRRKRLWENYYHKLHVLCQNGRIILPKRDLQDFNGHIFYFGVSSKTQREALMLFLRAQNVQATFHYLPLHKSPFWLQENIDETLVNSEYWGDCIIRLPLYYSLTEKDQQFIIDLVHQFFSSVNHL